MEFLKSFINVVLVFVALGLIMNIFEEINFFRRFDVKIITPIGLSFMVIPSMLVNVLPFIIFLSSMIVFIKLKSRKDLLSIKILGYSKDIFLRITGRKLYFYYKIFNYYAFWLIISTKKFVNTDLSNENKIKALL